MKQEYIRKLKTEDGYTFYLLTDGTVVDNLDANNVDMSFETLAEFEHDMLIFGEDFMFYEKWNFGLIK